MSRDTLNAGLTKASLHPVPNQSNMQGEEAIQGFKRPACEVQISISSVYTNSLKFFGNLSAVLSLKNSYKRINQQ